jgi:hypothetical protein
MPDHYKQTGRSDQLFGEYNAPSVLPHVWSVIKWIEMAVTVVTLMGVMLQVILLDPALMSDALIWSLPTVAAAFGALRKKSTPMGRTLAMAYLLVLASGMWIARSPHLLPGLNGFAGPNDPFHQVWNHLPLISRRILTWNIQTSCVFLFVFSGYVLGYSPLRARRLQPASGRSPIVSCLALIILWGLGALLGLGFLMGAMARP